MMAGRRKPRQTPDGQPAPPTRDTDSTRRSRVSEVQDPVIAGDAAPKATDAGDAAVDEAGQVRPKQEGPDLLH